MVAVHKEPKAIQYHKRSNFQYAIFQLGAVFWSDGIPIATIFVVLQDMLLTMST